MTLQYKWLLKTQVKRVSPKDKFKHLFLDVGKAHVVPPGYDSAQTGTQYILNNHGDYSVWGHDFVLCHSVNSDQKQTFPLLAAVVSSWEQKSDMM